MNKFMRIALAVALAAVMCVTAVADAAVPSIAQKEDITLVSYTVYDSNGDEASVSGNIVVTPYARRDDLTTEKLEDIEDAYEQILGIDSLTELLDHLPEDIIALYLFDISAYDEAADYLNAGGTATVTLECDLGDYGTVTVLHNYEDDLWREEPSEVISSNQVQVTISSASPYVVAVSNTVTVNEPVEGSILDNGTDVTAMATSSTMPYVIGGVSCIVIAGVLLIVANKKKVK